MIGKAEYRFMMKCLRFCYEYFLIFEWMDTMKTGFVSKEELAAAKDKISRFSIDFDEVTIHWANIDKHQTNQVHYEQFAEYCVKTFTNYH